MINPQDGLPHISTHTHNSWWLFHVNQGRIELWTYQSVLWSGCPAWFFCRRTANTEASVTIPCIFGELHPKDWNHGRFGKTKTHQNTRISVVKWSWRYKLPRSFLYISWCASRVKSPRSLMTQDAWRCCRRLKSWTLAIQGGCNTSCEVSLLVWSLSCHVSLAPVAWPWANSWHF